MTTKEDKDLKTMVEIQPFPLLAEHFCYMNAKLISMEKLLDENLTPVFFSKK